MDDVKTALLSETEFRKHSVSTRRNLLDYWGNSQAVVEMLGVILLEYTLIEFFRCSFFVVYFFPLGMSGLLSGEQQYQVYFIFSLAVDLYLRSTAPPSILSFHFLLSSSTSLGYPSTSPSSTCV